MQGKHCAADQELPSFPKECYSMICITLQVLEKDPDNVKALFRRAQAYMMTQDYIEAKQDLDLALRAEPTNRSETALDLMAMCATKLHGLVNLQWQALCGECNDSAFIAWAGSEHMHLFFRLHVREVTANNSEGQCRLLLIC